MNALNGNVSVSIACWTFAEKFRNFIEVLRSESVLLKGCNVCQCICWRGVRRNHSQRWGTVNFVIAFST